MTTKTNRKVYKFHLPIEVKVMNMAESIQNLDPRDIQALFLEQMMSLTKGINPLKSESLRLRRA